MLSARQFKVVGGRGPRRVPVKLPRTQNASVKRDLKQQKEALDKTISLTNVKHRIRGISVCVCVHGQQETNVQNKAWGTATCHIRATTNQMMVCT